VRLTTTVGAKFWAVLQPLAKLFVPARSPAQILGLGIMWGWLPCGLVYSAVSYAAVAGDVTTGGLVMLAFGLGTLPSMVLAGFGSQWLAKTLRSTRSKQFFGGLVIVAGSYMLWLQLAPGAHQHHGHAQPAPATTDTAPMADHSHHHHP